jgi:hypothetical protein
MVMVNVNRKPGVEDGRQDKGLAPMNYQLRNRNHEMWRQKFDAWRLVVGNARISPHKGGA